MKTIKDFNLENKTVLIRCDFNVPVDETGKVLDVFRLEESVSTINDVLNQKTKIVLMSHIADKKSLKIIVPELEKFLNKEIIFIEDLTDSSIKKIKDGGINSIFLLENLRFFDGEESNDDVFAEKLASLGDFYVNEAFSVCHRKHASVSAITKYIDFCAGNSLYREVEVLSKIKNNPERPLVAIIGGAKVESKIKTIKSFIEKADYVLLGGKTANDILIVQGQIKNNPLPENDTIKEVQEINFNSDKVFLPTDLVFSLKGESSYTRIDVPEKAESDEDIFDIGPETIKNYIDIIKKAGTIFWSGPLGFFEKKDFENGTREICLAITENKKAFKIVGGGDTANAVSFFNLKNEINHVSTGGGAMLKFLSGGELPGLTAIKDEN